MTDLVSSPSPMLWEFLLPSGSGTRVVRVFLMSPTPRIMFFSRPPGGDDAGMVPTSLFIDEIAEYILVAQQLEGQKVKGGPAAS